MLSLQLCHPAPSAYEAGQKATLRRGAETLLSGQVSLAFHGVDIEHFFSFYQHQSVSMNSWICTCPHIRLQYFLKILISNLFILILRVIGQLCRVFPASLEVREWNGRCDVRAGWNVLLVLHCLTNKGVCKKGNDVFPVEHCEPGFFFHSWQERQTFANDNNSHWNENSCYLCLRPVRPCLSLSVPAPTKASTYSWTLSIFISVAGRPLVIIWADLGNVSSTSLVNVTTDEIHIPVSVLPTGRFTPTWLILSLNQPHIRQVRAVKKPQSFLLIVESLLWKLLVQTDPFSASFCPHYSSKMHLGPEVKA